MKKNAAVNQAKGESPARKQSSNEVAKGLTKPEIVEAIEPPNLRREKPAEFVKAGRETPEQMKTPMVIELNNDDSDLSPHGG